MVERLSLDTRRLEEIRQSFPIKPTTSLQLRLGAMGSGAAVIGDADKFKEVKLDHRKTLAIDMEAYGVMLASRELPIPTPEAIVVKGVSDFGNAEKNREEAKRLRPFAAYASVEVLKILATEYGL